MQVFIIADILDTVCPFGVAWCPRNGAASTAGRSGWSVHRRVQQRIPVAEYIGTRVAVSIFHCFESILFSGSRVALIFWISYFTFRHRLLFYFQSGYPHLIVKWDKTPVQCARLQLLSRQEGRVNCASVVCAFIFCDGTFLFQIVLCESQNYNYDSVNTRT